MFENSLTLWAMALLGAAFVLFLGAHKQKPAKDYTKRQNIKKPNPPPPIKSKPRTMHQLNREERLIIALRLARIKNALLLKELAKLQK